MQAKEEKKPGCWPPADQAGGRQPSCPLPIAASGPAGTKATALAAADINQIRAAIREKYAEVSRSAQGKFAYPTGRTGAELLGYDPALLDKSPPALVDSFCGVGNPFAVAPVSPGETVLDIGCGGGFDLAVARWLVGPAGRVAGLDLTLAMIERARRNLAQAGLDDVTIYHVESEEIPLADGSVDVVISNGVINLSPCKERMFGEIYRVLKPGGRLQFADVILEKDLPASLVGSLEAWSQWIGGTVPVRDQIRLLGEAGFIDSRCLGMSGFRTSAATAGALFFAIKPGGGAGKG